MSERNTRLGKQTDIPRLVKELRNLTGLTQEKLAVQLGVTFATVNRWENGHVLPSPLALNRVEGLLLKLGKRGNRLRETYFRQ